MNKSSSSSATSSYVRNSGCSNVVNTSSIAKMHGQAISTSLVVASNNSSASSPRQSRVASASMSLPSASSSNNGESEMIRQNQYNAVLNAAMAALVMPNMQPSLTASSASSSSSTLTNSFGDNFIGGNNNFSQSIPTEPRFSVPGRGNSASVNMRSLLPTTVESRCPTPFPLTQYGRQHPGLVTSLSIKSSPGRNPPNHFNHPLQPIYPGDQEYIHGFSGLQLPLHSSSAVAAAAAVQQQIQLQRHQLAQQQHLQNLQQFQQTTATALTTTKSSPSISSLDQDRRNSPAAKRARLESQINFLASAASSNNMDVSSSCDVPFDATTTGGSVLIGSSNKTPAKPLQIDTQEVGYYPQVEAISPTGPEERAAEERDELMSTKEDLLQNISKGDREIAKAESSIAKMRKIKQNLEDLPKNCIEYNMDEEKSFNQFFVHFFEENREKSRNAKKLLQRFGPNNGLPFYNQPSDNSMYFEVKERHRDFKKTLMDKMKKIAEEKEAFDNAITKRRGEIVDQWKLKVEQIEDLRKSKSEEIKEREIFETTFEELRKAREVKERNLRLGSRVRSEAEFNEAIERIQEEEEENKRMHSYAVTPPVLLSPLERSRRIKDTNGLIRDPLKIWMDTKFTNIWLEPEVESFKKAYLQHPKSFRQISQSLDRKDSKECVQYYYLSKKNEHYKALTRKSTARSKRGGNKKGSAAATSDFGTSSMSLNIWNIGRVRNVRNIEPAAVLEIKTEPETGTGTDSTELDNIGNTREIDKEGENSKAVNIEESRTSIDHENHQTADASVPHVCVLCAESCEDTIAVSTKSFADQLGIGDAVIGEHLRICYACHCKVMRRKQTQCPIRSCTTNKGKARGRLRPPPNRWSTLPGTIKDLITDELEIPCGTSKCCATCFSRLSRKIAQYESDVLLMHIGTNNSDTVAASSSAQRQKRQSRHQRDVSGAEEPFSNFWSPEETMLMKEYLKQHGKNWDSMSLHIETKSSKQCEVRYYNKRKSFMLMDYISQLQSDGVPIEEMNHVMNVDNISELINDRGLKMNRDVIQPSEVSIVAKKDVDSVAIVYPKKLRILPPNEVIKSEPRTSENSSLDKTTIKTEEADASSKIFSEISKDLKCIGSPSTIKIEPVDGYTNKQIDHQKPSMEVTLLQPRTLEYSHISSSSSSLLSAHTENSSDYYRINVASTSSRTFQVTTTPPTTVIASTSSVTSTSQVSSGSDLITVMDLMINVIDRSMASPNSVSVSPSKETLITATTTTNSLIMTTTQGSNLIMTSPVIVQRLVTTMSSSNTSATVTRSNSNMHVGSYLPSLAISSSNRLSVGEQQITKDIPRSIHERRQIVNPVISDGTLDLSMPKRRIKSPQPSGSVWNAPSYRDQHTSNFHLNAPSSNFPDYMLHPLTPSMDIGFSGSKSGAVPPPAHSANYKSRSSSDNKPPFSSAMTRYVNPDAPSAYGTNNIDVGQVTLAQLLHGHSSHSVPGPIMVPRQQQIINQSLNSATNSGKIKKSIPSSPNVSMPNVIQYDKSITNIQSLGSIMQGTPVQRGNPYEIIPKVNRQIVEKPLPLPTGSIIHGTPMMQHDRSVPSNFDPDFFKKINVNSTAGFSQCTGTTYLPRSNAPTLMRCRSNSSLSSVSVPTLPAPASLVIVDPHISSRQVLTNDYVMARSNEMQRRPESFDTVNLRSMGPPSHQQRSSTSDFRYGTNEIDVTRHRSEYNRIMSEPRGDPKADLIALNQRQEINASSKTVNPRQTMEIRTDPRIDLRASFGATPVLPKAKYGSNIALTTSAFVNTPSHTMSSSDSRLMYSRISGNSSLFHHPNSFTSDKKYLNPQLAVSSSSVASRGSQFHNINSNNNSGILAQQQYQRVLSSNASIKPHTSTSNSYAGASQREVEIYRTNPDVTISKTNSPRLGYNEHNLLASLVDVAIQQPKLPDIKDTRSMSPLVTLVQHQLLNSGVTMRTSQATAAYEKHVIQQIQQQQQRFELEKVANRLADRYVVSATAGTSSSNSNMTSNNVNISRDYQHPSTSQLVRQVEIERAKQLFYIQEQQDRQLHHHHHGNEPHNSAQVNEYPTVSARIETNTKLHSATSSSTLNLHKKERSDVGSNLTPANLIDAIITHSIDSIPTSSRSNTQLFTKHISHNTAQRYVASATVTSGSCHSDIKYSPLIKSEPVQASSSTNINNELHLMKYGISKEINKATAIEDRLKKVAPKPLLISQQKDADLIWNRNKNFQTAASSSINEATMFKKNIIIQTCDERQITRVSMPSPPSNQTCEKSKKSDSGNRYLDLRRHSLTSSSNTNVINISTGLCPNVSSSSTSSASVTLSPLDYVKNRIVEEMKKGEIPSNVLSRVQPPKRRAILEEHKDTEEMINNKDASSNKKARISVDESTANVNPVCQENNNADDDDDDDDVEMVIDESPTCSIDASFKKKLQENDIDSDINKLTSSSDKINLSTKNSGISSCQEETK